jgi:polyketide cyclase/dehydrase/lipid transport protein
MNRVDYQGEFWFPVPSDRLWTTIERFDLFESWWGWLREFHADTAGLVAGNALHGTVVPPVPYRLRLDIRLYQCDRPRSVQAVIGGDVTGRATLRLEDADGGTRVAVAWSLEMRSVPLRVAARLAYPLMRWGHDQVVGMAIDGFRQSALTAAALPPD